MKTWLSGWCVFVIIACLASCGDDGHATPGDDDGGSGGRTTATLTVQRTGDGRGTIVAQGVELVCAATCTATVAIGATITVVATPDAGAVFGGWTGGGCRSDAACTTTVSADTTLTAAFDVRMVTIEVELLGSGAGVVTSSSGGLVCPGMCSVQVPYDTALTLTAAPTTSSLFLGWSDGCSGTECTLTAKANAHVGATFAKQNELVVVKAGSGGGTVTAPGIACGVDCSELYQAGAMIELVATPDNESTFAGWSGGGCAGAGPCAVTIDAATQVTATFALQTRRLTVAKPTGTKGIVTSDPAGIDCRVDCQFESADFPIHSTVVLTPTPATDWKFSGWAGACAGAGPCTVKMDSDAFVDAIFLRVQYKLSVALAGPGTGSVTSAPAGIACATDCDQFFDIHTQVVLTATPQSDAVFAGWSGGGCTGTGACTVTMDAQAEVTATFAYAKRTLTIAKLGNGAGVVSSTPAGISCGASCTASYDAHTMVALVATPAADSVFVAWSGACSGNAGCTVALDTDLSATATFALKKLALSVSIVGTGTVASLPAGIACPGDCAASYDAHTVVTLTATAPGGAKFTGWSGACSGTGTCQVTMDDARAVTAQFAPAMLLVSDFNAHRLVAFAAAADGDIAPLRTLAGPSTTFKSPRGLAVFNGEVYVADQEAKAIDVYPVTAAGNVAPTRRITSSALGGVTSLVVYNNELYASQTGAILVFPATANGDVTPTRTLSGLGLSLYMTIADGLIYVTDYANASVVEFPASTPSGNVTPLRILGGPAGSQLHGPAGVFVDGNELFVTNVLTAKITVYAKSAEGSTAPLRTITGPALGFPDQIVVFNNEIYVVDYSTQRVVVYARNASGNATPVRQILGTATTLSGPTGVWVY